MIIDDPFVGDGAADDGGGDGGAALAAGAVGGEVGLEVAGDDEGADGAGVEGVGSAVEVVPINGGEAADVAVGFQFQVRDMAKGEVGAGVDRAADVDVAIAGAGDVVERNGGDVAFRDEVVEEVDLGGGEGVQVAVDIDVLNAGDAGALSQGFDDVDGEGRCAGAAVQGDGNNLAGFRVIQHGSGARAGEGEDDGVSVLVDVGAVGFDGGAGEREHADLGVGFDWEGEVFPGVGGDDDLAGECAGLVALEGDGEGGGFAGQDLGGRVGDGEAGGQGDFTQLKGGVAGVGDGEGAGDRAGAGGDPAEVGVVTFGGAQQAGGDGVAIAGDADFGGDGFVGAADDGGGCLRFVVVGGPEDGEAA